MRNISFLSKKFQAKRHAVSALLCFFLLAASVYAQNLTIKEVWSLRVTGVPENCSWSALSVSVRGDVFILSTNPGYVVQLNDHGSFVNSVGGFGFAPSLFDHPQDLFAKDGLSVYVADTQNQRIQRFASKLEFVSALGDPLVQRSPSPEIKLPLSVGVSGQSDLFYIDGEKLEVVKMNRLNQVTSRFGGFSDGSGALKNPFRLCVDKRGIFVADGSAVLQFDYFGNFVRAITSSAVKTVSDVAVGSDGYVYITDKDSKCIHLFDGKGVWRSAFTGFAFENPVSIDIRQKTVYVLDSVLESIIILSIEP